MPKVISSKKLNSRQKVIQESTFSCREKQLCGEPRLNSHNNEITIDFHFQNQPTDKAQRTNYHSRTKCKYCKCDIIKVTIQKKFGK